MDINDLVKAAHERAIQSGWWSPGKSAPEVHMLIVTEIAEATEACRGSNPPLYYGDNDKPEGEAIELVDAVIRIADYFGHRKWDMEALIKIKMAYNQTRPHRHGDKNF
jgi:hypothetical protein